MDERMSSAKSLFGGPSPTPKQAPNTTQTGLKDALTPTNTLPPAPALFHSAPYFDTFSSLFGHFFPLPISTLPFGPCSGVLRCVCDVKPGKKFRFLEEMHQQTTWTLWELKSLFRGPLPDSKQTSNTPDLGSKHPSPHQKPAFSPRFAFLVFQFAHSVLTIWTLY